jgi:hypothetical protein
LPSSAHNHLRLLLQSSHQQMLLQTHLHPFSNPLLLPHHYWRSPSRVLSSSRRHGGGDQPHGSIPTTGSFPRTSDSIRCPLWRQPTRPTSETDQLHSTGHSDPNSTQNIPIPIPTFGSRNTQNTPLSTFLTKP